MEVHDGILMPVGFTSFLPKVRIWMQHETNEHEIQNDFQTAFLSFALQVCHDVKVTHKHISSSLIRTKQNNLPHHCSRQEHDTWA